MRAGIGVLAAVAVLSAAAPAGAAPSVPFRVQGTRLAVRTANGYAARFWPGVNLGATIPGRQPGEVAIPGAVYRRWFAAMGRLGVRVVRVYTILPPHFYAELARYDRAHRSAPLYLIQGVWIPEERFLATGNAFDPEVTSGFDREIADAVGVVHGRTAIARAPGHASGRYTADVSPWLLAWSPGIEWDPQAVASTDRINAGAQPHAGTYISSTADASPMESWLAARLDGLAAREIALGVSRPLTFTNWITTDPLRHPSEPFASEDLVGIDATHLRAGAAWPGGFFASYHAYPYYPDFLGIDPDLLAYKRPWDGKVDPYAGDLAQLRAHHGDQAVMITEFGQATGIGVAHRGPLGRDQGGMSERTAARHDAAMLDDIREEGLAGGVVFEWADEWFKRSWNTQIQQLPAERRALWHDALTSEQHFGILATEPVPPRTLTRVLRSARGPVREIAVGHDAAALHVRVRLARAGTAVLGFDVRPGANRALPGTSGLGAASEVALTVGPGRRAVLVQAAWDDPFAWVYGAHFGYEPFSADDHRQGSGVWSVPRLITDRPATLPDGEQRPLRWAKVRMPAGAVTVHGTTVSASIPWALLTFADPSSRQAWAPNADGTVGAVTSPGVRLMVAAAGRLATARTYRWPTWNAVRWHERLKAGADLLRAAFRRAR